ncbi:hypothetical protein [Chryseosolibacter indicus]|uniref:VWFA domain-containing protein n=1 Tax=Chryseosolibacter indicus TaxID=2782351 RepID=A0ABS5VWE8_9BACT|nr:hypothetical protein [Chryseosolibacter indicus]MBT1705155.1 hypothetical protein [Chryseosolibacter indicus]
MKNIFTVCSIVILVTCGPAPENKNLSYKNIVILSDMSSRINNTPPKDIDEIHKILEYFKNECVKPGEKIGDKSSISFSAFSEKNSTSIDINQIKNLGEKQRFINSTGEYKNSGLIQRIEDFEKSVRKVYATTKNPGLDLISVLIEKIENEPTIKQNTFVTDGVDTTFINYENDIYIFTDGYLEYLNKSGNNQFYFGIPEIEKIRQFCKINSVDISTALDMNSSLSLQTIKSKKNKHINLHILETHERDFDTKNQTYKYPKGLRDNEILEAVWRKWAKESGFNNFEWKKY